MKFWPLRVQNTFFLFHSITLIVMNFSCFQETFVSMQEDDGSVVVDSLFIAAPIVCEGLLFGLCFDMRHLVSHLVSQSSC